jgi:hypothetical protein
VIVQVAVEKADTAALAATREAVKLTDTNYGYWRPRQRTAVAQPNVHCQCVLPFTRGLVSSPFSPRRP